MIVSCRFLQKTKTTTLACGKHKRVVKRKRLDDPSLWPIILPCPVNATKSVKFALNCPGGKSFTLRVDDRDYDRLIYQQVFDSDDTGKLKGRMDVNEVIVFQDFMMVPLSQMSCRALIDAAIGDEQVESIELCHIDCDQATGGGLLDLCAHVADPETGLQELTLDDFKERMFPLEERLVTRFVESCSKLCKLTITGMRLLPREAVDDLVELANGILTVSKGTL